MIRRRPLIASALALAGGAAMANEVLRTMGQAGMTLKFNARGDGPQGLCIDHVRALQGVDPRLT